MYEDMSQVWFFFIWKQNSTYVICQLTVCLLLSEKLWPRSWKCCLQPQAVFSGPWSQFFTTWTNPKQANSFYFLILSLPLLPTQTCHALQCSKLTIIVKRNFFIFNIVIKICFERKCSKTLLSKKAFVLKQTFSLILAMPVGRERKICIA